MQEARSIRLLALDFDGVIVDSVLECAVVAYNGYHAFQGSGSRIKSPQEIPVEMLSKFRSTRPYIRSGEDYLYLFQALDEGITIVTQAEFDKYHDSHLDRKESYYQLFYAEREALIISDYENWIALNPLYNGMVDFLQSLKPELLLQIVSTKVSRYISEILDYNGIKLDSEQIHQAGRSLSKTDIVKRLLQENQLSPGQMVFVDDHPDTVRKVSVTDVVCFLAGWGYNTADQHGVLASYKISVIDIHKLIEIYIKNENT